jgi:hypothetical protein
MSTNKDFIKAVLSTGLFTPEEKEALIDVADVLPKKTKKGIIEDINGFNKRSQKRSEKLKLEIKEAFTNYKSQMEQVKDIEQIDQDKAKASAEVLEDELIKYIDKLYTQ